MHGLDIRTTETGDKVPGGQAMRANYGYVCGNNEEHESLRTGTQFAIDPASDDFLHKGVFSCYRPIDPAEKRKASLMRAGGPCSISHTTTRSRRSAAMRIIISPQRA